jgi:PEP-CTERM motif
LLRVAVMKTIREGMGRMRIWTPLLAAAVVAVGSLGSSSANAAAICGAACEFDSSGAGTYLGSYDPTVPDTGAFTHNVHLDVAPNTAFTDLWVFDVTAGFDVSISADFTIFTDIDSFTGTLHADDGSVCGVSPGDSCGTVLFNPAALDSDSAGAGEIGWQLIALGLAAGRYVIEITGTSNGEDTSVYTGQLSFRETQVPEPGTLGLLALAMFAAGAVARSRKV